MSSGITLNIGLNPAIVRAQPVNRTQAEQNYQSARELIHGGSLLAAKSKLLRAAQIYQALNDKIGQYNCQVELARIEYKSAKYQQAVHTLRLAAQLNNHRHLRDGRAKTLSGLIDVELGRYRQALNQLQVGIHELRISGTSDRLSQQALHESELALGEVYFHQGLYQQAESTMHRVLRVTATSALRRRAYNTLGSIQLEIGQYEEAKAAFQQAAGVANTTGDYIGKARTLENLGRAYQVSGNKALALKHYQQALGELRRLGAWSRQVFVLNNLGLLAMDLGLKHRALEYFQSAEGTLSSSGSVGQVLTYINLGYYYSEQKQYDLAIDYLERALSWATSKGDRLGEAKALAGLGDLELQQKQYRQASYTLESSVAIFESLRPGLRDEQKISLAESQKYTYDLLQQAYIARKQPSEALIVAERSRARAFIELLAQNTAAKSEQELDINPPNLAEIKAIAKNRQATLVSYAVIENKQEEETLLYVWVINPEGRIDFRQLNLAEIKQKFRTSVASVAHDSRQAAAGGLDLRKPRLEEYIVSFRGDLRAKSADRRRKLGFPRDAYKMLIAPIKELLPENPDDLVVFIPQGSLFLVPFPALQNATGEFLIEQHTIQIAPSIQTLAMKKFAELDTSQALIVGNPSPMPDALSPLAGAETEAKAIAKILATTPIIGESATESAVIDKMERAKLIHLATHGLFDEHQGLQSSLAFSTKDNQEGFLTAAEILDLDLVADLVVLSACNTGRGKITGDGVVGLSRSFLLAGAQSTMVSLWYVPDLSTSALMTEFYQQIQTKDATQPQALRRAMLKTMETYPSPREWAAFMLVGQ
ncbi:MAG: CHAT domain-containing tetratricopeptide repeat protein [Cyanobacteria bacterium J06623_7]